MSAMLAFLSTSASQIQTENAINFKDILYFGLCCSACKSSPPKGS